MKFLSEYREPEAVQRFSQAIRKIQTKPWTLMEICGGQTHTIVRFNLEALLPKELTLVHGPGCPVCVTPLELIDKAIQLASQPGLIFCSFGDMLRVPGSTRDLLSVKASGGDVRIVYSPLDALSIARQDPTKQVVFFAVGFETTAPANAMAVIQARQQGIGNFSLLVSQVLVPPAMEAILSSPQNRVQGFLAAGHVCTVMGFREYEPIADKYHLPIVVTGFEPVDLLQGIFMCVEALEQGKPGVINQYTRVVKREGNPSAQKIIRDVFEVVARKWRGVGDISRSGLGLVDDFAQFDAEKRFGLQALHIEEPSACQAGQVLQGIIKPPQCAAFGKICTPEHPLGAPMVSSEGACAAYYRYREAPNPLARGD